MSESGYDLQSLAGKLCSIVGEENVLVDEPMSEHTTLKVVWKTLYIRIYGL